MARMWPAQMLGLALAGRFLIQPGPPMVALLLAGLAWLAAPVLAEVISRQGTGRRRRTGNLVLLGLHPAMDRGPQPSTDLGAQPSTGLGVRQNRCSQEHIEMA